VPQKRNGKTVLITLGRLPKALELARALNGAGCRVLVADPFHWHLCRPSNSVDRCFQTPPPATQQSAYLDRLLDIVKTEKVDLVVPVSEEALHVSLLASRLPPETQLFSNPHDVLWQLHDKLAFNTLARDAGLTAPETYLASDPKAQRLANSLPTVSKPRVGCSGQDLKMLTPGAVPPSAFITPDALIQKRVSGREVSTLSLCRNGEIIAHVTYEGLVFSGTVAVCFERVDDAPQVKDWVAGFVKAGQHSYFLAFDFIIDDKGTPWPLECNPRLTSGIHFMDPAGLARAICGLEDAPTVGVKSKTRFQEGHTTLLQVYGSVLNPKTMARRARAMVRSRDVLWSGRDPLPFPMMTYSSWPVLKQVLFKGRTFGEAATRDIAWPADGADPLASNRPSLPVEPVSAHGS